MQTAIIKAVDFTKGLGYVQETNGREVVLMTKGLEDKITAGTAVRYDIKQTRVGIIAVNVEPIS